MDIDYFGMDYKYDISYKVTQYEQELLSDILDQKITSPRHLYMKMQIAGVTPSPSMMYRLLGYSYHDYVCDFICEGIFKNILVEFIDDNFVEMIALQFNLKYFRRVGVAISKVKPGKLIRCYLVNKKVFKNNYGGKYLPGVDAYEDFIYNLSTKIAQQSEDFKEKHYERIKDQYYEIADFKAALGKF